jgi:hypothetical protein
MTHFLFFVFGILVGAATALATKKSKDKKSVVIKYAKYKSTAGLYEGVRRK